MSNPLYSTTLYSTSLGELYRLTRSHDKINVLIVRTAEALIRTESITEHDELVTVLFSGSGTVLLEKDCGPRKYLTATSWQRPLTYSASAGSMSSSDT